MIKVAAVLLARLVDPLSIGAAFLTAWAAAGASGKLRMALILLGAPSISAGVSVFYCSLQSGCREPFDGQGVLFWLIGSAASLAHLLTAFWVVGWLRRRR